MILSRYNLNKINTPGINIPDERIFTLPEKVLQFGTGVLLRGLPDYFIDKANREGVFNGRVVVVKSTNTGSTEDYDLQDGLYTLHIKGLKNGHQVDEEIINSSISRVLTAASQWDEILSVARSPQLQVIISNTTEMGIALIQDDIKKQPPVSFPGKLLAVLYERFKALKGSNKSGLVIVPTELITDNGKKLESIVFELAHLNKLEPAFMDWLESCNHFCNSLVDRIVPGKPQPAQNKKFQERSNYTDNLRIIAEPYCLWAIEGNKQVKSVLSFSTVDPGIIITPDITTYRELKLRLLNGTHTLCCAMAILAGFKTVKDAMTNDAFVAFIKQLMQNEIGRSLSPSIDNREIENFIAAVTDRFSNPDIEHQWISISAQYSSKFKMRVLPLMVNYYARYKIIPDGFVTGFAAFLLFMNVQPNGNNEFVSEINSYNHLITDNNAHVFFEAWKSGDIKTVVRNILSNVALWDIDMSQFAGFEDAVAEKINMIGKRGALPLLEELAFSSLIK